MVDISSALQSDSGELYREESSAGGDGDAKGEKQIVGDGEGASDASCT